MLQEVIDWKTVTVAGEVVYNKDDEEKQSKPTLKVLTEDDYTPRIPRKLVEVVYNKRPSQTKILHFLYSYSYQAIKQGKYNSKEDNDVYIDIEISLKDFRRWFKMSNKRSLIKLNELKKTLTYFDYRLTEHNLLIDFKIDNKANFDEEHLDYLMELSKKEATLTNNQLLFLKRIQAGSRILGKFNFDRFIKMRVVENKSNPRVDKKLALNDLKLFQELGFITNVEYLDDGRQIKFRIWKKKKAGVGMRLKGYRKKK